MPCFPLINAIFFSFGCLRQFNLHWRRTRIPLSSIPVAEIQDFLNTPPTWCQLDTHTPYLSFMMLVSLELFWRQTFNHERHVKTILILCCLGYGL